MARQLPNYKESNSILTNQILIYFLIPICLQKNSKPTRLENILTSCVQSNIDTHARHMYRSLRPISRTQFNFELPKERLLHYITQVV